MTPFEVSLENELHIEVQRFANDWLFKWHGMTYEGGKTDVEDFAGGRIRYAGIKFGYQQQQIFWHAIDRYLVQRVHAAYGRWEAETREYPVDVRRKALEGTERQLGQFAASITSRSLDTDRRLRGYPGEVEPPAPTAFASRSGGEIVRLAQAHRALMEAVPEKRKPRRWEKVENFLSSRKGIMSLLAFLAALIFGLWRVLIG